MVKLHLLLLNHSNVEYMDDYLLVHSENEEEVGTDLGLKFDFDKIQITPAEEKTQ